MQKVNLLYVITKLELGGAQKQLLSLISHLDKSKYRIFLFTAHQGLLIQNVSLINDLTLYRSKYLEGQISPIKDIIALIEIFRFIKKNKIEIVHTHSSKAGILGRIAAKLAGKKFIIHTVHGWSFNDSQPFFMRNIFICLERLAAQFTKRLIVVSSYDKGKGLENGIGKESNYTIIRYGINKDEFLLKDRSIKEELGIKDSDLVVGMVSCLKPQKSPQDFVRLAFQINQVLPQMKFILIGDGVLRYRVEKLVRRYNLQKNLILTGWRRDIPRILSAIDIFVLTSLWEGLPISVLEAMASAKPVVATHTGGIEEVIIEGKTGFLIPVRDVKKMSDRLIMLLKDGNLRKELGQNARDFLDGSYHLENMVNANQDLYENLVKDRASRKCRP
jgi:glycosyltransferase involved in cell wall biosynthesis